MSKLPFFLFSSLLVSTSAFALNCADGATGCIDPKQAANDCLNLGYALDEPDCDHYLLCPFNTDYKVCVKEKTPQEGKCHIGDIYFENGTCQSITDNPDLSENPIGVVFMLTDAQGFPVSTASSDHGKIIAKQDMPGKKPFGLCLAPLTSTIFDNLSTIRSKNGDVVLFAKCEEAVQVITNSVNWTTLSNWLENNAFELKIDGKNTSCYYGRDISPMSTLQQQCLGDSYGWDTTCDFEPYVDEYNGACDDPRVLDALYEYQAPEAAGIQTYCQREYIKNITWYVPSFFELLYLISDKPNIEVAGNCPTAAQKYVGKYIQGSTLTKVNRTLQYLDDEGAGGLPLDGTIWSVTYSSAGGMWTLNVSEWKARLQSTSNASLQNIRPIAAF